MRAPLLFLLVGALLLLSLPQSGARSALYNTSNTRVAGKLNVHVVSHTHNDPGWLFDYVQYYRAFVLDGHRLQGVEGILDTAVHALQDNPDRTWVYADLAFFIKWWQELHPDTKKIVRRLVKEGRWEFTNGGITQHDEATSHYGAMVDQMTLGMRFLYQEFGVQPKVAWQLDGFGHSNTEPMLKAMGGFEAVVFGRSDQQDFEQRKARHQLELVWRGSQSFGRESELFTSQYPTGNYGPPTMNWFFERRDDYAKRTFDGVMDDPESREYNLNQAVEDFVAKAKEWQGCTQGEDVMFLFGSDFTHGDARSWFHNVDKLIHYANKDGRVNAFYSTPSRYFAAKHAGKEAWAMKEDDFFPYCANNQGVDFWTGYFASRPTLKGQARRASALLQATRQVEVLAELQPSDTRIIGTSRGKAAPGAADAAAFARSAVLQFGESLAPDADTAVLEYAVAMSLHHDGLTGTSRLAVIKDYMSWLHVGMEKAVPKFLAGLQWLLYKDTLKGTTSSAPATSPAALSIYRRLLQALGGQSPAPAATSQPASPVPELSTCLMLNASVCASSVTLSKQAAFLVVVYNPLAWTYTWGVRVPVSQGSFSVEGPDGKEVPSQLLPLPSAADVLLQSVKGFITGLNVTAAAELAFQVSVPPLGHAAYKITRAADSGNPCTLELLNATDAQLTSGVLDVLVSLSSKAISSVTMAGKTLNLTHGVIIYQGHHMSGTGAYTFKANQAHERAPKHEVYLVKGPVVQEVREVYKDLGTLVTRLWHGAESLEVEWTLGPPPKNMNWEAFIRYESGIQSNDLWFTDANGREWQQRARQYRPAFNLLPSSHRIPGNIYPVTSGAFIRDNSSALYVSIDRAQGCASLNSGELDFLVHRASSGDDGKGMREPLIEENVATGVHIISFGDVGTAASRVHASGFTARHLQQVLVDPLQLAFSALPAVPYAKTSSGLVNAAAKPSNVHVLTLKWLSCNQLLLRLSHMFMTGEHPALSAVANLQLDQLLNLDIERVVEATLFGERALVEADKHLAAWRTSANLTKWKPPLAATGMTGPVHSFLTNRIVGAIKASTTISLAPMQIRAFYVTVTRGHGSCTDAVLPQAEDLVPAAQHHRQAAAAASRHEDEAEELAADAAVVASRGGSPPGTTDAAAAAADPHLHPLDQMRRSSAALLHRASHGAGEHATHLTPSALLAMLVLPFTVVFVIAYALFNYSKKRKR